MVRLEQMFDIWDGTFRLKFVDFSKTSYNFCWFFRKKTKTDMKNLSKHLRTKRIVNIHADWIWMRNQYILGGSLRISRLSVKDQDPTFLSVFHGKRRPIICRRWNRSIQDHLSLIKKAGLLDSLNSQLSVLVECNL